MSKRLPAQIRSRSYLAGGIGVMGLLFSALGWVIAPRQFYVSYLCAELTWLGVAMGCLAFLMIHYLTGGQWGWPLRRIFEAAGQTLPWLAILFIPVIIGIKELYPWAGALVGDSSKIVNPHPAYFNLPLFAGRAALFFCIWILISRLLRKWSREQDQTNDVAPTKKLRKLSAPGLAIYPLTVTIAFV